MPKQKWIPWPYLGQIDVSKISPILNSYHFRRLSEKKQLSLSYFIFPGADHDRRSHSMGAYKRSCRFNTKMVQHRILSKVEAHNVNLFSLLHDIGHGPFSHLIEQLTQINHEQNGLKILELMRKEIEACGGDVGLIKDLMAHKNPLHQIVTDKNFGMEKLDYLVRDQANTEFGPNISCCAESVFNYMTYSHDKLMVDLKALDSAIEIQRAYIFFYRNVHLGKSPYIIQRFLQKLIYQLLNLPKDSGGITEDDLWGMVDGDLLYRLRDSKNEIIKNGMIIFDNGEEQVPKTVLAIRPIGQGWRERKAGKQISVKEVDSDFFDNFSKRSKPRDLAEIERIIANTLGIPEWEVVVSHIAEKNRFVPKDITFYDGPKIYSLKKKDPLYFQVLEQEVQKYLCVRTCVAPKHRKLAHQKSKEIFEKICDFVSYKA